VYFGGRQANHRGVGADANIRVDGCGKRRDKSGKGNHNVKLTLHQRSVCSVFPGDVQGHRILSLTPPPSPDPASAKRSEPTTQPSAWQ
jgi:hypothetical protein